MQIFVPNLTWDGLFGPTTQNQFNYKELRRLPENRTAITLIPSNEQRCEKNIPAAVTLHQQALLKMTFFLISFWHDQLFFVPFNYLNRFSVCSSYIFLSFSASKSKSFCLQVYFLTTRSTTILVYAGDVRHILSDFTLFHFSRCASNAGKKCSTAPSKTGTKETASYSTCS